MMPFRFGKLFVASAAFAVAVASFVSTANADFIGAFVSVQVSNGNSSASFESILPPTASENAHWKLGEALQLKGGPNNELIATIDDLDVSLDGDPVVSLNFAITAGNSTTNVVVSSAVVAFSPLLNPLAKASAAITLTDNNLNGGALNVIAPHTTGMYQAVYNGGTVFTEELGSFSIGGGSLAASNGNPPFTVIAGSVSSIEANYAFSLSPLDSASGTSNFTVLIPEPASLALFSLGCVAMMRRR